MISSMRQKEFSFEIIRDLFWTATFNIYKYAQRGRHVAYSLNIQYTCLPCKILFTITCLNILHIIYIVYNLLCSEIDV